MIGERMKMNVWTRPSIRSFFWRNYNQSEVDYVESHHDKLSAYEIKWSKTKKNYISRAFTNLYPDAFTKIISPDDFITFTQ
jgi:hypothetical protein